MTRIFLHPSFLQFGGAERTILDLSNNKNSLVLTFFKTKKVRDNFIFSSNKKPFFERFLGYKANPFTHFLIKKASIILAKKWKEGDEIIFSNFPASLIVYHAIKLNPKIKNAKIFYFCFEPDKLLYYDKTTKYEYLPEELKNKKTGLASKFFSDWKKKDSYVVKNICSKVLTMSEFVVEQVNRIYKFNKCIKIGDCYVDKKKLRQIDKAKSRSILNERFGLNIKKDDKIVLSLSRLEKEKGFLKILEVSEKMPEFKFLIAGKGFLSKSIKKKAKNNLFYLGYIPEELLSIVYSSSDIFLFLGKEETSGPFVLVEAMHTGNKIVASNEGSVFEYVVHEKNGFLVNPKYTEEIIGALRKTHLFDTEKENKDFVEKYCLLEKTVKGFDEVIKT